MKRSRLERTKGLPRPTKQMERGAVKKVNRARRRKEFARVYGSLERVEAIRAMPSVVSGKRPCVNAHVPPEGDLSGMGRKPDWRWVVPLTDLEHRELHAAGIQTYERRTGVDLRAVARRLAETIDQQGRTECT